MPPFSKGGKRLKKGGTSFMGSQKGKESFQTVIKGIKILIFLKKLEGGEG